VKRKVKILKKEIIAHIVLSCILFIFVENIFGQQADSGRSYISYGNKLGIYLYGISKFSGFEIKGTDIKQGVEYSPNSNFNLGAGLNYKWIGLGLAFNFGFINNSDKKLYGDTKSLDIQFEGFLKKYIISGNFQVYKSYYWKNPTDFFSGWNDDDSLIVKPNISTVNLGVNVIHVYNHESFSLKSAYMGTERQLCSAGSWLLGGKASLYAIADDSTLVPEIITDYYPNASKIASLAAINIGGAVGYSYSLIVKKYFFINLTFMLGVNIQQVGTNDASGGSLGSDAKLGSNAYLRFAIGSNKDDRYYGMSLNIESYLIKNPNKTQFSYDYGKFKIYYGRRFNIN
jgi:hypothetical protein